jgi:hypothetical protein
MMNKNFFYTGLVAVAVMFAACQTSSVQKTNATMASSASASASVSASASASNSSSTNSEQLCITEEGVRLMPDLSATPGRLCTANDLDFDGTKYVAKVPMCRGNVTDKMKLTVAKSYNIKESDVSKFTFDHYIPLTLGGANDVSNIWPVPKEVSSTKKVYVDDVTAQLRDGKISQEDAVRLVKAWKPSDCK